MNSAHTRGRRLGPFVVGMLVGLVGGVLLVWLGIIPAGPLASGAAPPVAQGEKSAPTEPDPGADPEAEPQETAISAQPLAELACLQRKLVDAEGRTAVQQLVIAEKLKGAPAIESDPDYYVRLLEERGYSCSANEIDRSESKLEQKMAQQ